MPGQAVETLSSDKCLMSALQFSRRIREERGAPLVDDASLEIEQVFRPEVRGPVVKLPALEKTRKIEDLAELRIGTYNMENILERTGKWVRDNQGRFQGFFPHIKKEEVLLEGNVDTLLRANSDIAVLEEIESLRAIEELAAHPRLGNRYRAVLIEGNDERGIDIAFLVKKDLPLDLEIRSHREVEHIASNGLKEKLFSRDAPVALIRPKGADEESEPLMAIIGVHNKSQRNRSGDPLSYKKRRSQARELESMVRDLEKVHGADFPVMVTGDFNASFHVAPEYQEFRKNGMTDAFDLMPRPPPHDERVTQFFFPRDGERVASQMDVMALNRAAKENQLVRDVKVIPYLDQEGHVLSWPRSFKERKTRPSDHHMVSGVFDFRVLLNRISSSH